MLTSKRCPTENTAIGPILENWGPDARGNLSPDLLVCYFMLMMLTSRRSASSTCPLESTAIGLTPEKNRGPDAQDKIEPIFLWIFVQGTSINQLHVVVEKCICWCTLMKYCDSWLTNFLIRYFGYEMIRLFSYYGNITRIQSYTSFKTAQIWSEEILFHNVDRLLLKCFSFFRSSISSELCGWPLPPTTGPPFAPSEPLRTSTPTRSSASGLTSVRKWW
jgi:hypothetical protein